MLQRLPSNPVAMDAVIRCLFGPPGKQVREYLGGMGGHDESSDLPAAQRYGRRGQE